MAVTAPLGIQAVDAEADGGRELPVTHFICHGVTFHEEFWSQEGFIALLRNKPFMIMTGSGGDGLPEADGAPVASVLSHRQLCRQ